ncbi:MAG: hypothetical protein CMJ18_19390 [Phycisphaeraceae bacterium]|nr:hypothetical protein [Phycisphaeraceae bacterium]
MLQQARRPGVRLRLLATFQKVRHRYDLWRAICQAISIGILAAVPLTGLIQFDAWRGDHRLLFERVEVKPAIGGVLVGIVSLYVIVFLTNFAAGRIFCGWGCPVAQINRFGERAQREKSRWRMAGTLVVATVFNAALILSMFAWFVDLRVLWVGTSATLTAWSIVLAGLVSAYGHGRWWRWGFCKSACPIGLYYSIVSPAHWYGVHFRNESESCIECNACDRVCPVDLAPRDLMAPVEGQGLGASDAPGRNHCIECGDCVRACEWMMNAAGAEPVPLHLGYFRGPQCVVPEPSTPEPVGDQVDPANTRSPARPRP